MKKFLKAGLLVLFIVVVFFGITALSIADFGAKANPTPSDSIIILGCRLYGTVPSPFLQERLNEGLRLYQEGYGKYIIVSGGQGPGEDISEAEAMRKYLIKRGMEQEKIIIEDNSFSTMDNLSNSREKLEEYGLKDAVIVSNKYHLKRASLMAKKLNLEASYSGVYVEQYESHEAVGFLREMLALLKFYILKE